MPDSYLNIQPDLFEKALQNTLEKMYKKSRLSRRGIAADLGLSQSCIDKIMQGRNKVSFVRLMQMLQSMGIRPSAFFRMYEKELDRYVTAKST